MYYDVSKLLSDANMTPLSKMIQELMQTAGLTEAAVALRCNTTQPTIHRIKVGAGASYNTGKQIEALHRELISSNPQEPV